MDRSDFGFLYADDRINKEKPNKIQTKRKGLQQPERREDFFLKNNQAWSVAYQKRQKNKNASIRKLNDNCGVINEMQGVS